MARARESKRDFLLSSPQRELLLKLSKLREGDVLRLSAREMRHLLVLEDSLLVEVRWERKLGARVVTFSAYWAAVTGRGRSVVGQLSRSSRVSAPGRPRVALLATRRRGS